MKPQFFKLILLGWLALAALAAVSPAQQPTVPNGAQSSRNAEAFGENDRLPFMQTGESAPDTEPSSGGLLARTLGAMLLIVGLIFAGAWGLKKLGFGMPKAAAPEDAPALAILSSVSLGSGRTISTVRFGTRTLLVGSTAQTFTLLADESNGEETLPASVRSVADLLAEENDSFAAELEAAESNLNRWPEREGPTV